MKIKSVKSVDNGTEVVVLLDENETLDIDVCRKAGKQAEYDAYVIVDMLDNGIIVGCVNGDFYRDSVAPNKVACMIHDNLILNGVCWDEPLKYYYYSFDNAQRSAYNVTGRRVCVKGFNTKTGKLFDLEEN